MVADDNLGLHWRNIEQVLGRGIAIGLVDVQRMELPDGQCGYQVVRLVPGQTDLKMANQGICQARPDEDDQDHAKISEQVGPIPPLPRPTSVTMRSPSQHLHAEDATQGLSPTYPALRKSPGLCVLKGT